MERKPLKPLKDIDSSTRTRVLGIYIRIFPGLALIGLFLRGLLGVVVAALVSAIVTLIVMLISDKIGGGVVKTLYGVGRTSRSLRNQLASTMDEARYHKMQNQFDKALQAVNAVLEHDPDFPDALFLKAQILCDGFGNTTAARQYLRKVIKAVPNKDEPLHRWAMNLHEKLVGM